MAALKAAFEELNAKADKTKDEIIAAQDAHKILSEILANARARKDILRQAKQIADAARQLLKEAAEHDLIKNEVREIIAAAISDPTEPRQRGRQKGAQVKKAARERAEFGWLYDDETSKAPGASDYVIAERMLRRLRPTRSTPPSVRDITSAAERISRMRRWHREREPAIGTMRDC